MKRFYKILLGLLLLLWFIGYFVFIWGRLPGQYDPTVLSAKSLATGDQYVCGWNWRSPMLWECGRVEFFYGSARVYSLLTIYLPLAAVLGLTLTPFFIFAVPELWPAGVFVWIVILSIAYFFYRRYKRKYSQPPAHDPHPPKNKK